MSIFHRALNIKRYTLQFHISIYIFFSTPRQANSTQLLFFHLSSTYLQAIHCRFVALLQAEKFTQWNSEKNMLFRE